MPACSTVISITPENVVGSALELSTNQNIERLCFEPRVSRSSTSDAVFYVFGHSYRISIKNKKVAQA